MQIEIYIKQNFQLLHKRNAEINYGSDRRVHCVHFSWVRLVLADVLMS